MSTTERKNVLLNPSCFERLFWLTYFQSKEGTSFVHITKFCKFQYIKVLRKDILEYEFSHLSRSPKALQVMQQQQAYFTIASAQKFRNATCDDFFDILQVTFTKALDIT